MVLWEITLATAYFLGLKRTYKLALKMERRLVSANHPKVRDFLHRRTRAIFDMAVSVHKNVQQRDIEYGRNFGNWVLRWLDRMKPSAEIRVNHPPKPPTTTITKTLSNSNHKTRGPNRPSPSGKSDGRAFITTLNTGSKSFPSISMMRSLIPVPMNAQYRRLSFGEGVIRKDIREWMSRN